MLLVVVESVVESREPLVGVPVKLAEDADPLLGTTPKLVLALADVGTPDAISLPFMDFRLG